MLARTEPQIVYDNIREMFKYHNLVPNDPPPTDLTRELTMREYVVLRGVPDPKYVPDPTYAYPELLIPPRPVNVVLFAPGTDYASKTASFKKLIDVMEKEYASMPRVIFVSSAGLSRNIVKFMPTSKLRLEEYTYDIFMTDILKHQCYPSVGGKFPFRRLSALPAEYADRFISLDGLPRVLHSNPMAVWCGVSRMDLLEYEALSETAGLETRILLVT